MISYRNSGWKSVPGGGIPGGNFALVDSICRPPRQCCREAEQLMVEVVAQAPQRLGDKQSWGGEGICDAPEPAVGAAAGDPDADGAADQ